MKVWIATMAAFVSHSLLAAAGQTGHVQSNHLDETAPSGWRAARYPRPDTDELELDLSLSELVDLEKRLSPSPPRIPSHDLVYLRSDPLLAEPGWMPFEGVLVGPGISLGLGFPIQPLGQ
jgi:hypothetical protein